MSCGVKSSEHEVRVHVMRDGRALCRVPGVAIWQQDIGPANCRTCAVMLEREKNLTGGNGENGERNGRHRKSKIANGKQERKTMKVLNISSVDGLDVAVADVVRLKVKMTQATAAKDTDLAAVEKRHQKELMELQERIAEAEAEVQEYCNAHRPALFTSSKSRETGLAVFGFELTPHRVETSSRKITWKDVVKRLGRLPWGKAYVRQPAAVTDKQALLTDREKLSEEQCIAAGIAFAQDEQFFIRPKLETAAESVKEAA